MASKSPSGEIKDEHIRVLAPLVTERQPSNARQPISSLPFDVINLILNPENLPDAIDLARLRVVNRAMRDAMTATGREMKEMNELNAVNLGCLSTLKHLHSRGHLERKEWLCMFAARSGQLEVLQWARANGCLWNGETCYWAATGGHLEILQWARANGCPWNENTCWGAAQVGPLEVLRWARANGCPWDRRTRDKAAELGYMEKDD
jgi:hypothetical protein